MNDNCELCGKPGADMAFHYGFLLGRIHAKCLNRPDAEIAEKLLLLRSGGRDLGDMSQEEVEEILAPAEIRAWKEKP